MPASVESGHGSLQRTSRPLPVINVAVAVVQHSDGRVLLAERPKGKVSGGCWEFPGGKFEIAEDARRALARELHEEVGIELDTAYPWMTYDHAYDDKVVRLHVFRVLSWHGTPHGREGQRIAWEDPAAVTVAPLLPANSRVLHALSLPPVYAITQAGKYGVSAFMPRVVAALEAGVRLIQVREPGMTTEQLAQFARRVTALARRYQARVLVNGDVAAALRAGADGVHLQTDQLMRLRTPPAMGFWAASCHRSEELAQAARLGANFVVVSQVLPTASHPGRPGMGWDQFAVLTRNCPLPVYALGGMRLDLLETAMRHGAHGVAVHSDVVAAHGAHHRARKEESHMSSDQRDSAHKPQFPTAPGQANKAPTVEDALAAAAELKPMIGVARRIARERRAAIAQRGKMALPPEEQ